MNVLVLIPAGVLLSFFLYKFYLWLNRGKKRAKDTVIFIGFSLSICVIITTVSVSTEKPSPLLYFPLMTVVILAFMYFDFFNILKGRQNIVPYLFLFAGIACSISVPYLPAPLWMIVFLILGLLLQACFFLYLHRYPFLNSMWLDEAVRKSAAETTKDCGYSPKPIIIRHAFRKRAASGTMNGLLLLIKRDKAIIRISLKLHRQLGKPNLSEFGNNLIKRIVSHQE